MHPCRQGDRMHPCRALCAEHFVAILANVDGDIVDKVGISCDVVLSNFALVRTRTVTHTIARARILGRTHANMHMHGRTHSRGYKFTRAGTSSLARVRVHSR
eukprot:5273939-Pleurochrysis_carterae.AAC.1